MWLVPNFHFFLDEDFAAKWRAADRTLPLEQQIHKMPVFVIRGGAEEV